MEDDILLELYYYCKQKYSQAQMEKFLHDFEEEFPYPVKGIDPYNFMRNFMDWLVLEKVLPATGKRITESYIEDHPEFDAEKKQNILNTKNIVVSKFVVIAKAGLNVKLKDTRTGAYYNVVQVSNNQEIQANTIIIGRVFPYGNIYRFAGALLLMHTPLIADLDIFMHAYEKNEIGRAESILLSPTTKLAAALNKYPFQWVDGICKALFLSTEGQKSGKAKGIAYKLADSLPMIVNKLPEKSKEVLSLILKNGGLVKYGMLKGYDDEITWWWNSHPPKSSIGLLRLHGLVVVGKIYQGSKQYKAALIPKDIRILLQNIQESKGGDAL